MQAPDKNPEKDKDTGPPAATPPAGGHAKGAAVRAVAGTGRRVGQVVSGTLWPDLPQVQLQDVLGTDLLLQDCTFLRGSYTDPVTREISTYAVIKFADVETGEEKTTLCGGNVVVRKLRELQENSQFPIIGQITLEQGGSYGRYYDIA